MQEHLGGIWDASRQHLGNIWEASRRHLRGMWEASWEASGASGASWRPERTWRQKCFKTIVFYCI